MEESRFGSSCYSFGRKASVIAGNSLRTGEIVQLEGGTSTQTNTAPEQVFLNKYSGTVRTQNFNDNWKFYLGDASGAQTPAFDDSSWDQVNLPHDYSIDQKYSQKMEAESGYLPGGTGWYRKNFTVDESLKGKRISIDFGGVYMNATIYVKVKSLVHIRTDTHHSLSILQIM